jgi:electron transfer flavoprotein alpha subunit
VQRGKGILICERFSEERVPLSALELLTVGRQLADELGQDLGVFVLGQDVERVSDQLIACGADILYAAKDVSTAELHPELYALLLAEACQELTPSIILFPHNDVGRDVAPRLASKIGATICTDCIGLTVDGSTEMLSFVKPVYGGQAVAVWASRFIEPCIATLRPRATQPAKPMESRRGRVVMLDISAERIVPGTELIETVKEDVKGVKLEEADVIVAGGGGIGGVEGFTLLTELAELLRGAVGVSRVPCDEGWMPKSLEVGQTGRTVNPKLYIAVGISGALQHMAGCSGSKCIIGINRDSDAHIFTEANFGIVGDYRQVLPALISAYRAAQGD